MLKKTYLVLIISLFSAGVKAQQVQDTVAKNEPQANNQEEKSQALDEVVVVGYGTLKKNSTTGSVSSIKGDAISVLSTANVQSGLAGRATGVEAISGGSVDSPSKVRIRGVGTINNSDPLYVVDGYSTNDISYLAPTDIESIEVLKDASACAIYGSRGANGVILLKTKKGVIQKTKVSINSYYGIRNASTEIKMLNAVGFSKAIKEAYVNGGQSMDASLKSVLDYSIDNNLQGTNWQKELIQTAEVKNINIALNGGNETIKYNLSSTYLSEQGVLKNSYVDKLFVRLNTDYKLSDKIKLGTDVSFVDSKRSNTDVSDPFGSALMIAVRAAPVTPVFDQYGNWERTVNYDYNAVRVNDFEKYKKYHTNKFIGNFFLDYNIIKGLSFKSTFGVGYNLGVNSEYNPTYYVSQQELNQLSSLREDRSVGLDWVWSNVVTYNFDLGNKHKFNTMMGTEANYGDYNIIYATAYDVPENVDMRYLSASKSTDFKATSIQSVSTIFSAFVRANYSFDNRYLLTATLRSDSSSRFSEKNRTGIFPSVSLGWNFAEETFLKESSVISLGKLRAGWGIVGNQASVGIGDYLAKMTNGKKYVFGGKIYEGIIPTELSNPDLKWEEIQQTNIGLDLGFLNGKLQTTMDFYVKNTNDMIVRTPVPSYVGAGAPLANVGNMQNKGFEFSANYSNNVGEFKYNAGFNISFSTNKVISLGNSGAIDKTVYQRVPATNRTETGKEIAYYYGYKTDGVFNTQEELDAYKSIQPDAQLGDVKYVDVNGNGKFDSDDRTYLGSYMPDYYGGINLGFEYKNFDFSALGTYSVGNEIANLQIYEYGSGLMDKNIRQSYYDNRWTPEMPNNNQPRLTTSSAANVNSYFSDRYIEDASYFRLRNIQLGYNFSKLIGKGSIDKIRLYVSADNLFTLTNYSGFNPEIADQWGDPLAAGTDIGGAPLPRTISVGFNLNF